MWNTLNAKNPFIPCGYTDELGNGSGVKDYTVSVGGTPYTVSVPRYRGIENPFGHIWNWCEGVLIDVKNNADGGTSEVYVCDDPAKFSNNDTSGYAMRGLASRMTGYVKELLMGEYGDIVPSSVGGGSSVYWCDDFYTLTNVTDVCVIMIGGSSDTGLDAGLIDMQIHLKYFNESSGIGSRLCFIPVS